MSEETNTQAVEETTPTVETITEKDVQETPDLISLDEARKLRREAQSLRHRLKEFEEKQQKEAEAKLSETELLKKQLGEAQAALRAKQMAELRQNAARAAGLPEELADRLNGETEEELTIDALALARSIPKPQAVVSATNPGVPPRLTEDAIRGMTPDEINKNWAAVGAALSKK